MKTHTFATIIFGLAICAAKADICPPISYEVSTAYTGGTSNVSVYKFNPLRGVLVAVRVRYFQRLAGTLQYENTYVGVPAGGSTWTGYYNGSTNISLTLPKTIGSSTFNSAFSWSKKIRAGSYDGVLDYGGMSGANSPVTSSGGGPVGADYTYRITDPLLLANFIGVSLPIVDVLLPDLLSGTVTASVICTKLSGSIGWTGGNPNISPTILDLTGSKGMFRIEYEYIL